MDADIAINRTFSLPLPLVRRLNIYADQHDQPRSHVLRDALVIYLAEREGQAAE